MRTQRSNTTNAVNPEIHRMTIQVREVLPHVPYNVIYRDLSMGCCSSFIATNFITFLFLVRTRNVDVTITNILEGNVVYTPEIPQPSTSIAQSSSASSSNEIKSSGGSSTTTTNTTAPRDILCTAASTFGKTAQERMLSYHERKKLLIETARRKYIEKHELNDLMLKHC